MTLVAKETEWERRQKRLNGVGGKIFDRTGEKRKELLEEVLVSAYDLSDALGYLHRRQIVYRDVKPGSFELLFNVGNFGVVNLFLSAPSLNNRHYLITTIPFFELRKYWFRHSKLEVGAFLFSTGLCKYLTLSCLDNFLVPKSSGMTSRFCKSSSYGLSCSKLSSLRNE
jgi:serine/threonine protein kinase